MDPLTAVGLVANIVQFVDLGYKIFANTKEIRHSISGLTVDDQRTSDMMTEMYRLSLHLESPGREPSDANEKALFKLAAECRKLADQILKLMEKTSAKNPGSMSEAIRSTVRKVRHAREQQELEQKLSTCRSHLHFHLSYVSSANTKRQLMSLATKAETQTNTIKTLDANIERLRDTQFTLSPSSSDFLKQIREIVQLPQAAREAVAQQQILRSLDHDESHLRYEIVDKAHQDTFRWIIEKGPSVKSDRLTRSRELFRTWLSEEQGIFHVVGKLGSGKSTLMKFLFNHPNTVLDLRRWSGDRRLALVKFFFWRPGSIWQNSVKGLLRGLVHNTLQSCPELISVAFPSIWEGTVASLDHALEHFSARSIDDDTIQSAFSNILKHASVLQTHRLCFFIDGLDEQNDSSPQNDHKALVETIQHWVDSSQGSLKVCVSSREDNVFTNAFRSDRRLRLQDLTKQDLEAYVRQKLPEISCAIARERITQTIVNRSDGIFLWVVLVVKALRQAFEDGHQLYAFEAELNSLPSELEALFENLLKTIPIFRRKNAYCLFKLILLRPSRPYIPVYAILYLEKYLTNPRFALENDPSTPKAGYQSILNDHLSEDIKARKILQGDSRGLLESVVGTGPGAHFLTFTHRSVPEFLQRASTQEIISGEIHDFIPGKALAQMFLGQLLAVDETRADIDLRYSTLGPQYFFFVLSMYHHAKIRQHDPMDNFLVVLERELERKGLARPASYTHGFYGFSETHQLAVFDDDRSTGTTWVSQPYYLLAYFGDLDYVQWKLEQDPLLAVHRGNRSLLLACMFEGAVRWHRDWKNGSQLLQLACRLLNMGPLDSPEHILPLLILWLVCWQSDHHGSFVESKPFFGPLFAAVLSKIEEQRPTAITLGVEYQKYDAMNYIDVRILWDGKDIMRRFYRGWKRPPGHEISRALGGQGRFNIRDVIQLLDFENGEEILALIDKIAGPESASSDTKRAAVLSPTLASGDASTRKEGMALSTADSDPATESEIASENTADGHDAAVVEAHCVPLSIPGSKMV